MKNNNIQNDFQKKQSHRRYKIAAVTSLFLAIASLVFIYFTQEQNSDPASEKIIREITASQLNKDQAVIPVCWFFITD
jgi:hypothetical protein